MFTQHDLYEQSLLVSTLTLTMEFLKEFDSGKRESKSVKHLQIINENDEYGTPNDVYQQGLKIAKFKPDVDVSASVFNHKCDYYLTIDESFLDRSDSLFESNQFANFPYSLQYQMMEHAWNLYQKFNGNWLILAYSKTDTKWWHQFVEGKAEVHFIEGRVRFLGKRGEPLLSRYCLNCKKKTSFNLKFCSFCMEKGIYNIHTIWKENTSPYPSCFIIYRKKELPLKSRIFHLFTDKANK